MSKLEDALEEMFELGDYSSIALFLNADDKVKWQCNVCHRFTGSYGIGKSDDPAQAMLDAMANAKKALAKIRAKAPAVKKKPSVDDLL